MTIPAESEERIVHYLLDEIVEKERLELEDRLFHEPAFFEEVHSVEDDLILRFVRGDLDRQQASRFSEVYMDHAGKQARVESARAWRQAIGEAAAAPRLGSVARIRLSIAAAAALAILAVLWSPVLRKNPVPQFVQTPERVSYASFLLEPGLTRSGGTYAEINVPPGTDVVLLELALPYAAGQAKTYHAVLGTPERPAAWNGPAAPKESGVVASVPARVFRPGDYTLELQADGKELATYSFRVPK